MKTAILVDTGSDLTIEQADKLGIHLLWQTVLFDGEVYVDGSELAPVSMFERIRSGAPFPTTQPMSVDAYRKRLKQLLADKRCEHVFAIHLSKHLSNTFLVAQEAAQSFPGQVTIFDSQCVSGPMAMLAERAAHMAQEGRPPKLIASVLGLVQQRQSSYFGVSQTDFLLRSQRVGNVKRFVGELLGIKPVLTIKDGRLIPAASPRSKEASLTFLAERLRTDSMQMTEPRVGFFHNGDAEAVEVLRLVASECGILETMSSGIGTVVSAHVGPGAYGFALEPSVVWHEFQRISVATASA